MITNCFIGVVQIISKLVKRTNMISSLTSTEQQSYTMFTERKMSVDEIAKERILQPSTVMGHLATALEAGYFVDYRKGKEECVWWFIINKLVQLV